MKIVVIAVAIAAVAAGCTKKADPAPGADSLSVSSGRPGTMDSMGSNGMRMGDSGMHSGNGGMMDKSMMTGDMEKDMAMMGDMMMKGLGAKDSLYDHRFIDMMIPHHEGAVLMAKDALTKTSKPELNKLAQSIISSQQKEIDQMKAWRTKWYGENTSSGMSSSQGMMGDMSKMNSMMTEKLGPKGADYEDNFIDMMIPHHEGAVAMANDALTKAGHPEMKKLAADIIATQKKEIAQMEAWRKAWYGH